MSDSKGARAAQDLIRRQGRYAAPTLDAQQSEVRTPSKWKASLPAGQAFRPEAFDMVVWRFGVPFPQIEGFHQWLATNEITIAALCSQLTTVTVGEPPLVSYLGTYLEVDIGGPRYEAVWGLRGTEHDGVFDSEKAEDELTKAFAPNAVQPALRDLVKVLRGYWVRDPAATEHRYSQARLYADLPAQNLGCFWELTRLAIPLQPLP